MTFVRRSACVLGPLLVVAAATTPPACTSATPCTPDNHGFTENERVLPRALPGSAAIATACARPRVEVIASEDALRQLYAEIGTPVDGGASEGAAETPTVDFSKERVIVREGPSDEGVSWTVVRGDVATFGLLSCGASNRQPSCIIEVRSVPALVARADTRTCDPVGCGNPQRAPVISR